MWNTAGHRDVISDQTQTFSDALLVDWHVHLSRACNGVVGEVNNPSRLRAAWRTVVRRPGLRIYAPPGDEQAARTMATMPARTASGSESHRSMTIFFSWLRMFERMSKVSAFLTLTTSESVVV